MFKFIAVIMLAVVAFLAALVGPMAATGNLNAAVIAKLLGREPEEKATTQPADTLGPLARALQSKEENLDEREQGLDQREEELLKRQQELNTTLTEITEIQKQIQDNLDRLDAAQSDGVAEVANNLAAMDAVKAARSLEAMAPEEAATILPLIKARTAGKILDNMEDRKRNLVLAVMQERKY